MTSVSAYLVYRSRCCQNIFDEPLFASSNSATNFDLVDFKFHCEYGKTYFMKEMEYVGIRRETLENLKLLGLSEITIPVFLRKS